jgi:hypothetical protein
LYHLHIRAHGPSWDFWGSLLPYFRQNLLVHLRFINVLPAPMTHVLT